MKEELQKKIKEAEVISFDIFDTLITRIVDRPETIFEIMEQNLKLENFSKIRQEMQAQAGLEIIKEKGYPHANLKDIYEYIENHTDIKNSQEILKYELYLEKKCLYQNPEMFEIYQFAKKNKKRVIITSDMYIELDEIEKILKKLGYNDYDKIYLSSSVHKAKFDGSIYDLILLEEEVDASKILHIGDNFEHDYNNATLKGLKAFHYTSTIISDKSSSIAESFHNGIKRLLSLKNKEFWYNIGTIGGLMYLTLFKELNEKQADKICFLSRDGYNLHKLFEKLNNKKNIEYIYTSRRALLLASIYELDDASLNNLPPFTFGQTVAEILEYISMREIFSENDLLSVGIESFEYKIKNLEDFQKMKKLYLSKKEEVLNVCEKEREYAAKYYKSLELEEKKCLFFDCGWNGSSQYLLENFLEKKQFKIDSEFYYTGIFDNEKSRKQLANRKHDAYLFDIGKNQDFVSRFKDSIIILELFFGAPHGSILKYDKNGAVLEKIEDDFEYKKSIFEGILDYVKFALPIFEDMNITVTENDIMNSIIRLIERPTLEEAIGIGNLKNLDGFAYQKDEVKYIGYLTPEQLKKNKNIEIYWYHGVLKRNDIDESVKIFIKNKFNLNSEQSKGNVIPKKGYYQRLKDAINKYGYRTTLHLIKKRIVKQNNYEKWIREHEIGKNEVEKLIYQPLISIVVPVFNAIPNQLYECVNSVLEQTYTNWELILVDDCSTSEDTKKVLKEVEHMSKKIKVFYHSKNEHISKTTNDGIKESTGEFIALLDNDDILAKNALYENVKLLNNDKTLDFIYSDEDKLTEDGKIKRYPFFKPDWSPDTFMSLMYTCHFAIFRKKIVDKIGGFTVGLDGAQDYDFVLRFTGETNKVGHIPKILYHWRERVGSIANDPKAKPYALDAIIKLKENELNRKKISAEIQYENTVHQYRVKYNPTEKCHVIIKITNQEYTKNLINFLENIKLISGISLLATEKQINFDEDLKKYNKYDKNIFKNGEIKKIKSNILLFIEDTIAINDKIIEILIGHANQKNAGIVGPKILLGGTSIIYSCGITPQLPYNVLRGFDDNEQHYYCRNRLDYNVYSVSEKCFAIKKKNLNNFKKTYDENIALNLGEYLLKNGLYNVIRNDAICTINTKHLDNRIIIKKYDAFLNENIDATNFEVKNKNKIKSKVKSKNVKIDNRLQEFKYEIEIDILQDIIQFNGYVLNQNWKYNNSNKVSIILKNESNSYVINSKKIFDNNISRYYGQNLNFISFKSRIKKRKIKDGTYKLYLLVENKLDKTKKIQVTNQKVLIKCKKL